MDRIEASTVVYVPPEEVYEFLLDFPGYTNYSGYLEEVEQFGDGDTGTEYALSFTWWKLSYTARSAVVDLDPPSRIDWELVDDLDARGHWEVERVTADGTADAPEPTRNGAGDVPAETGAADATEDGDGSASLVRLVVVFDPSSATPDDLDLDLPRLVSIDWVIEKVRPLVTEEAERVVERIVADLEGEQRDVDLAIETPGHEG